jgi:hypothetical protein
MGTWANKLEHDHIVRQHALDLLTKGYQVKARVEGWFEEPDVIYGYIPDIYAVRDDEILIIEVKKADTDWPKISALHRFEETHPNCKVEVISAET